MSNFTYLYLQCLFVENELNNLTVKLKYIKHIKIHRILKLYDIPHRHLILTYNMLFKIYANK